MRETMEMRKINIEHHHGLYFCSNVKDGLACGVSDDQLNEYVDWFVLNHLLSHFKIEEKYLFPVLGMQHPSVLRAMNEHRRIEAIYRDHGEIKARLELFISELNQHILFEEKILFRELENVANEEQLAILREIHGEVDEKLHSIDLDWTTMV